MIQIKNAVIITDKLLTGKNLYIKDNKIEAITSEVLPHEQEIDANGLYLSPGFIDIHTHGGGGYDFADGEVSDILSAAQIHAAHGTTAIFPTCTSSSFEDTINFIQNVKASMDINSPGKPYIAGSHLEGPYFSQTMCGAQNTAYLKAPIRDEYEQFVKQGKGTLKRISFAPELDGTKELCRYLTQNNIIAAYGHTDAIYEEILPLIPLGCTLATHLYSGMSNITRRNLMRKMGAVETAYLEDDIYVEIIADGIHLPPDLLKLIFKIKGADKICLVTDSMRGAGMPDGPSVLGPKHDGMECNIHDGVAYLNDMSGFAGSIATSDRLVRTMYKEVKIPLCDCIKMMCQTPAKVMKLCSRGKIEKDYIADLVLFDDDINVKKVIIQGKELKTERAV